jgi:very-short-patch-repair endonuclease
MWEQAQIGFECGNCGKSGKRQRKEAKKSKSGLLFCDKSCAASYNNTLKRRSRRSQVEKLLFEMLKKEFPHLTLKANDKTLLDGYEVDIAVPDIPLAIEWNGIVHFKPIYGINKLNAIQQRDQEKCNIATKKRIPLIVIPDLVSNSEIVQRAFLAISDFIRQQSPGSESN